MIFWVLKDFKRQLHGNLKAFRCQINFEISLKVEKAKFYSFLHYETKKLKPQRVKIKSSRVT